MFTVSARYVSGFLDNHANGLRVAACNLFADEARRQGLDFTRTLSGPGDTVVTYAVAGLSRVEYVRLIAGCHARGLPKALLQTDPPTPADPTPLAYEV